MKAIDALAIARSAAFSLSLALILAGCHSKPGPSDAALNQQVAERLTSDRNLAGQPTPPLQISVAGGVVTLSGTVSSEAARSIAIGDAAQVPGVKSVTNAIVVQPQAPAPQSSSSPAAPQQPATSRLNKPSAAIPQPPPATAPAPVERIASAPQPAPQPAPVVAQAPPPPPPPPAPVVHNITLPAGTTIPVRVTQTLDSGTTQTGDRFSGAVASDIIQDGMVVLAQGTPVTGHVDAVQDAAHFKGSSLLTISLSAIDRHGEHILVTTDPYSKQGEGRGKNTAEKVGGGAAVGAILGGIFGHGAGAAIGSVAGAGAGAGVNAATRGQQVQIPSETVVRFRLSDPITVRVFSGGNPSGNSGALEHHTDQ